jgi:site-specific DNA-adenine methylase
MSNRNEQVEVRCEHFSLCKQMADKGFDKIYINPSMTGTVSAVYYPKNQKLLLTAK